MFDKSEKSDYNRLIVWRIKKQGAEAPCPVQGSSANYCNVLTARLIQPQIGHDLKHAETTGNENMSDSKPTLMTYKKVMKELDISKPTLWRLIRDGRLHIVYVGTAPRIEWAEVEEFIKANRRTSQA